MFRLAAVPTMRRTVKVLVPDPEIVDKLNEQTLTLHYRVLSKKEATEIDAKLKERTLDERLNDPHGWLRNVIIGWGDDIVDENGTPIPFSAEALERALEIPWFAIAARDEYARGINGEPRLGN